MPICTRGDLNNAESYTQDALRLARQNQHPRLEADSALTLASIRYQQGGRWDEEIALAREAFEVFQGLRLYGFGRECIDAHCAGRARRETLAEAHKDSLELVHNAEAADSRLSLEYAEDTAGSVSFDLEDYPDALHHYERALQVSRIVHENEAITNRLAAQTLCGVSGAITMPSPVSRKSHMM